jgi:hypothetical protein|tara:strand:- start:804 stop:1481 length:678 start_codon:yes stop_codon:yes gene_type:complete
MSKIITGNIATIPSRMEQLIKTIDSIINQVDEIRVAFNGYHPDDFRTVMDIFDNQIIFSLTNNEYGDAEKFFWAEYTEGYYLSLDDDIIYPPTYVKDMIKEIDKHGIVTHHGRSFDSFPITSYYKGASKRVQCLSENLDYGTIQFGGTGVLGFNTKHFKPSFSIFTRANMSDIWIGIEAHKQGKTITTLPHSENYFTYQHVEHTIWDDKNNDCEIETKIINDYFV